MNSRVFSEDGKEKVIEPALGARSKRRGGGSQGRQGRHQALEGNRAARGQGRWRRLSQGAGHLGDGQAVALALDADPIRQIQAAP